MQVRKKTEYVPNSRLLKSENFVFKSVREFNQTSDISFTRGSFVIMFTDPLNNNKSK